VEPPCIGYFWEYPLPTPVDKKQKTVEFFIFLLRQNDFRRKKKRGFPNTPLYVLYELLISLRIISFIKNVTI